jgi:hypothetical protein
MYDQDALPLGTRFPLLYNYREKTAHGTVTTAEASEDNDLIVLLLSITPLLLLGSYFTYRLIYGLMRPKQAKDEAYAVWLTLTRKQKRGKALKENAHPEMLVELNNLAYEGYEAQFDDLDADSRQDLIDDWVEIHEGLKREMLLNKALTRIIKTVSYLPVSVYTIVVFAMCIASCQAISEGTLRNRHYEFGGFRNMGSICTCADGSFTCAASCASLPMALSPTAFYAEEEVEVVTIHKAVEKVAVSCKGGSSKAVNLRKEFQSKGYPFTDLAGECGAGCVFGAKVAIHGFDLDYTIERTKKFSFTGVISDNALITPAIASTLESLEHFSYEIFSNGLECPEGFILDGTQMYCVDADGVISGSMWIKRPNESLADGWIRANGAIPSGCDTNFVLPDTISYPFNGDCSFVVTGLMSSVPDDAGLCDSGNKWRVCDTSVKCISSEKGFRMSIAGCTTRSGDFFKDKVYGEEYCTADCTFDPTGSQGASRGLTCGTHKPVVIGTAEQEMIMPVKRTIRLAIFAILFVAVLLGLVFCCLK